MPIKVNETSIIANEAELAIVSNFSAKGFPWLLSLLPLSPKSFHLPQYVSKIAFAFFQMHTGLACTSNLPLSERQHFFQVTQVKFLWLGSHQHIINVYPSMICARMQHQVYSTFENWWSINKPKWHPHVLKLAKRANESCLLPVSLLHHDLVEAIAKVDLGQHQLLPHQLHHFFKGII